MLPSRPRAPVDRPAGRAATRRQLLGGALLVGAGLLSAGCGADRSAAAGLKTLRIGYSGNLTHAVAVIGLANGFMARALPGVTLSESVFNAGPAAVEALLSEAVDAVYLGPNPAINAYLRTKRRGLRVVAGAATGAAALVVRPELTTPRHLRGTTLATPQLGGTQDVALRHYLLSQGMRTETNGGDDVTVVAQPNAQTLELFRQGGIAGGWLPEPWVSRMVVEGGARVLLEERSLWPGGVFPTTVLAVSQTLLQDRPALVQGLLRAHLSTVEWARRHPARAAATVNTQLARITGKALPAAVLERAYPSLTLGWDPLAGAARTLTQHAVEVGLLPTAPDLTGMFDLRPLNALLTDAGRAPVDGAGLEIR